ncbi:outer membrane beta-barrel protein [Vibrio europaeus]|uniref:Outer membrane beta-barrel protein n=1 Tax=Vibrio europaeus TaxID=300876 RepID=A0AAE7B3B1_9VIBR|nr:outer membrane beta-barrel protein [Vibrio europaeus]QPG34960.1 outer membrane beta-barrel protein [Vibrio europaeus]
MNNREKGLGYVLGAGARCLVSDHITLGVEYNITQPTFEQENGHEYSRRSKTWFVTAGYKF